MELNPEEIFYENLEYWVREYKLNGTPMWDHINSVLNSQGCEAAESMLTKYMREYIEEELEVQTP